MISPTTFTPDQIHQIADEHCTDCSWYHGFWPLIRALGFGTVPEDHLDFYRSSIKQTLQSGPINKILICGAADTSMSLLIYQISKELGFTPEITVLDRCETPLVLSRKVFQEIPFHIETVKGSALDVQLTSQFDLIVTHSFLGYFSDVDRKALLSNWEKWLRPKGTVLTVNRLRKNTKNTIQFSNNEATEFIRQIQYKLSLNPNLTTFSESTVQHFAEHYVQKFSIHPIGSLDDLINLGQDVNLNVHTTPLPNIRRMGPTGPTTPTQAKYFGFCLTKATDT